MDKLTVWRVGEDVPAIIGELSSGPRSFTYSASYLASENVHPISLSLPLQEESYDQKALLPYFDGLLPEGASRDAVAKAISIDPNDFMVLLLHCGINVPSATLLDLGRPVFCIERFDREVSFSNGELR